MGRITTAAAMAALLVPAPAVACPLCGSDTGRQVREGIFDGGFGEHLLALVLPFLVISVVAGLIHGGPARRTGSEAGAGDRAGGERNDSR